MEKYIITEIINQVNVDYIEEYEYAQFYVLARVCSKDNKFSVRKVYVKDEEECKEIKVGNIVLFENNTGNISSDWYIGGYAE